VRPKWWNTRSIEVPNDPLPGIEVSAQTLSPTVSGNIEKARSMSGESSWGRAPGTSCLRARGR
jgi:hypothetical protein